MAKKLTRLVCLLMAFAMAFSMVGCKDTKKKPSSSKTSSVASEAGNSSTAPSEDGDIGSDIADEEPDANWDDQYNIPTEVDDTTGIYVPESYYTTQSVLKNDDLDDDDFDDLDFDDDDDDGEEVFTTPIQKSGKAVSSASRVFNVDFNNTVYDDYLGLGSCVFPTGLMGISQQQTDYDLVNLELDAKRFTSMAGHVFRMWFQVDWIVTENESNPTRDDYENNVDYANYKKGVYDFNSTKMKAVYPYLDVWKSNGTEIALNYGWKAAESIQKWFCFPGVSDVKASAPYDLDAYAKSVSALMYELRNKRGYTNIDMLTFYNEPGQGYDYVTYVDDKAYWVIMLKKVNECLKELNIRDDIQIWSAEENSIYSDHHQFTDYIKANGKQYIDTYVAHYYYSSHMEEDNYETSYTFFSWLRGTYCEHPLYLTEYYSGQYGVLNGTTDGVGQRGVWRHWGDSTASYFIVTANTGIRAMLKWGFTGAVLPEPLRFDPAGGGCASWYEIGKDSSFDSVKLCYHVESLLTNYVPSHSDVLMIDWTGDDIRGSAFKSPSGEYTIVIEANGSSDANKNTQWEVKNTTARNIIVNLKNNSKTLNFYKYHVDPDTQEVSTHGTVNSAEDIITAKTRLEDTIGKEYGVYVYTTVKPIKQVEIQTNSVLQELQAGKTLNLTANTISCDSADQIEWKISQSIVKNGNPGTIDQNGKYLASADAESGDKIAIRASLKSDPKVFDVVIVRII